MANEATLGRPIAGLNEAEKTFLARARKMFAENMDWLEFESFAFGMRSPVYSKTRSQQNILEHPLYIALRDMWLELGVRQGKVADAERGSTKGRG